MWEQSLVDRKRWAAVVTVILGLAFIVGLILWTVFGWAAYLSGQVFLGFVAGGLYAGLLVWLFVSSRRKPSGLPMTEEDLEHLRQNLEVDGVLDEETGLILLREVEKLRTELRSRSGGIQA